MGGLGPKSGARRFASRHARKQARPRTNSQTSAFTNERASYPPFQEAVGWLKYTYMYGRMVKNPLAYGVTYEMQAVGGEWEGVGGGVGGRWGVWGGGWGVGGGSGGSEYESARLRLAGLECSDLVGKGRRRHGPLTPAAEQH